jgi:hypothetical protein
MDTVRRRILLASGAVGPPLFIAVFLLEGGTRPDYDPRRHPISSLALGKRGWRQTANFLMVGASICAFSRGIRLAWEARLLGVAGLGLIGAGLFATDPVFGYPTDAPLLLEQESLSGHLHNLASVLFFVGVPGACFAACLRPKQTSERAWWAYSLLSGITTLVTFVLAGAGFSQDSRLKDNAGVMQRLSVTTGLAWIALRAVQLLRAPERN